MIRRAFKRGPLSIRIWANVEKRPGCWKWLGRLNRRGRGSISAGGTGAKCLLPHRAMWIVVYGPISDDIHVLHKCDNPGCVNPKHLFLGTHQDNMKDMVLKNRFYAKLTPEAVRELRGLGRVGVGVVELARRFGITQSHVYSVLRGTCWRHVA